MLSKQNGSGRVERWLYSVPEVAEMFGVCDKTVLRLLERGLLQSSNALRHKRIPRSSLESFMAKTVNNGGGL